MLLSGAPHELQTIDEAASIIRLVNRIRTMIFEKVINISKNQNV